ncbi:phage baseplate assembly protein V [Vibrio sp. PP-XX7]
MIRRGRVHGVDFSQTPPRVQVAYDADLLSDQPAVSGWLPWVSGRAASTSRTDWEPLAVGEQVLILSESGDLSAGVVVPSLADATNVVPEISPDIHVSRYADGTTLSYDRAGHSTAYRCSGRNDPQCDWECSVKSRR